MLGRRPAALHLIHVAVSVVKTHIWVVSAIGPVAEAEFRGERTIFPSKSLAGVIYRWALQTFLRRPSRWARRLRASSLSPMARTKPDRA